MKQKTPPAEAKRVSGTDRQAVRRFFQFQFGAVFGKSAADLPKADLHRLEALRRYYTFRHNGYVLADALDVCTRNRANPPAWVLEALNEALKRFMGGNVTLERALSLGKRHRQEFEQYHEQHDLMGEVREIIDSDKKRKIAPACQQIATKHNLIPDTVESQYRKFWKPFFDYLSK